jgi:hypothetical protein
MPRKLAVPAIPAQPTRRTGKARMTWILRLVKTGAEGEEEYSDIMEINRPGDLGGIADLGLNLAEAKLLLAGIHQEIVAAQARNHTAGSPTGTGEAAEVPLPHLAKTPRRRGPRTA